jgi:hypothetical protein
MDFLVYFRALSGALSLAMPGGIKLGFTSPELAYVQGIPYPYSYYRG